MKNKTRPIEMYFGYSFNCDNHGDWTTDFVHIPIDTPQHKIEDVAKEMAIDEYGDTNLAFVGVYWIMPLEEVDEYYEHCK